MSDIETKKCQNCDSKFRIEPEDFEFYEKIKVPAPTFCPECRLQRRFIFWNLINLYKRPCNLCKKDFIAMYPPDIPYNVFCPKCWWSDNWEPEDYGRDYDFSRPFFEQFNELWHEAPMLGLSINSTTAINSDYNNHAADLKDCYLTFHSAFNENCAYGVYVFYCHTVFDCSTVMNSELCYDSMNLFKSSRVVHARGNVTQTIDSYFLRDSDNCQNCFASANLRNKKYHIFNKPFTKEEYFKEIKKWDLGSYATYQKVKKMAYEHWQTLPPRPNYDDFSVDCTGSYIFQSKNCKECYDSSGTEDCKFMFAVSDPPIKDCYDITSWGQNMQLCYEDCVIGENVSDVKFSGESGINLYNAEYCKLSLGGKYHFGCVSAKRKEYCILNKRYSEKEYFELRDKIIKHMDQIPYTDKAGRVYKYGEFFPPELSPFAYNESLAQNFFPLEKSQVEKQGSFWRDKEEQKYQITIPAGDLPDHIKDAPRNILQEVIGCDRCGKGFKIIEPELKFLKKMNLPLPRWCPFCRIGEKFDEWVKQLKIVKRICGRCGKTFETHYTKEEAPEVICKKCYQQEIM